MQAMKYLFVLGWLLLLTTRGLHAQPNPAEEPYVWPSDSLVSGRLQQWQDWKFGVLIHWGPYSQWGVVESWSLCPEDESWCERRGPYAQAYSTYVDAYEQLRTFFDPLGFNPEQWAAACRQAGMRYVVFTTKHHDGFCMYDSQYTDYKITDSGSLFARNPRSNIAKEVFSAFRAQGMGVGAYFSKPDWHNDDYWWPYFPVFDRNVNYNPDKYPDRWRRFQTFTYNQLEELMRDYGALDLLWLDGGWVRPAGSLTEETRPWLGKNQWVQDVNMPAIAAMARRHQPGLLIVDRTVHGEGENYRTPEQQIPRSLPPYPWESCITLGDNWYHTGPAERYKSADWAMGLGTVNNRKKVAESEKFEWYRWQELLGKTFRSEREAIECGKAHIENFNKGYLKRRGKYFLVCTGERIYQGSNYIELKHRNSKAKGEPLNVTISGKAVTLKVNKIKALRAPKAQKNLFIDDFRPFGYQVKGFSFDFPATEIPI